MHSTVSAASSATPSAPKNAIVANILSRASHDDLTAIFSGLDNEHLDALIAFAQYESDERALRAEVAV